MTLAITIIILLILAGITLNLTIGENGIIRRAIVAGQNYQDSAEYEQSMLDELMKETDNRISDIGKSDDNNDNRSPYESEFRKLVAEAITNEGVATELTDTTETFVMNIGKILQERTKETNAEEPQILEGYKAYSKGELRTGTMMNQGTKTISLNAGESYTIPEGYHNGEGKVTASSLESQTQATATAADIANGKTAWVNGNLITGSSSNSTLKIGSISNSYNGGPSETMLKFDTTNLNTIHFDSISGTGGTCRVWIGTTYVNACMNPDIFAWNYGSATGARNIDISKYNTIYLYVSVHTSGNTITASGISLY